MFLLDVGSNVFSPFSVAMGIFSYTFTVVAALVTVYMKPINGQGKINTPSRSVILNFMTSKKYYVIKHNITLVWPHKKKFTCFSGIFLLKDLMNIESPQKTCWKCT